MFLASLPFASRIPLGWTLRTAHSSPLRVGWGGEEKVTLRGLQQWAPLPYGFRLGPLMAEHRLEIVGGD